MPKRFALALFCTRDVAYVPALLLALSGCASRDEESKPTGRTGRDVETAEFDAGSDEVDASLPSTDAGVLPELDATVVLDAGTDAALDAQAEPEPEPELASLMMCGDLDTRWSLTVGGDRAATWANDIAFAFATALSGECRISELAVSLSEDEQVAYLNYLVAWTLELFGCPSSMSEGVMGQYGLTETGVQSVFTSADLELLSALYVGGVEQAIADVAAEPLPADKLASLKTRLDVLAAKKSGVVKSSVYTRDACMPTTSSAVSN